MSPSLKFIKQTNLDGNLYVLYRKLRSLFLEHGFTEDEILRVTEAPDSIWSVHYKINDEFKNIRDSLRKYGMIKGADLPSDVSEYLESKMKEIDDETSLGDNTGYYSEGSVLTESNKDFSKLEGIIKDKLNLDSFEHNQIQDHVIYWDGKTDINESVEAVWEVSGVEIIPSKDDSCDLKVHIVVKFNSDYSFVYYEDVGENADMYAEPNRIRISYPQDTSWIIDTLKSTVKKRIKNTFPFPNECVVLYFE